SFHSRLGHPTGSKRGVNGEYAKENFMRTTRYLLIQSQTIVSVPCFHARSHSCVSGHRCCALNPSLCGSRSLMFVMLSLFGTSQPASRRTPRLVPSRNSTKRRLNLHTRHAPPAASF